MNPPASISYEDGVVKLVKPYNPAAELGSKGGFGFIGRADQSDIFFHASECGQLWVRENCQLKPGMRVSFFVKQGKRGPEASRVLVSGREYPEAVYTSFPDRFDENHCAK